MSIRKTSGVVVALFAVFIFIWGLKRGVSMEKEVRPVVVNEPKESPIVEVQAPEAAATVTKDSEEKAPVMTTPEAPIETPTGRENEADALVSLIPDWLLTSGEVRQERLTVAGHELDRVRSRYVWSNGSMVEVEVSDLGENATHEGFKALGFDFDFQEFDSDGGSLRVLADDEDMVSNLEYSEEDGSGQVQYIVSGRYLLEIQLENLPLESFEALEERDRLFQTLLRHAKSSDL